jgi:hypothetical protein
MSADLNLTPQEVTEFRRMLEIEKIRRRKHLYAHLVDTHQIEAWSKIFAEDCVVQWGDYGVMRGRAAVIEKHKGMRSEPRPPYLSMHMSTNLWVELTGPATAQSRAYLHDCVCDLNPRINPLRFLGAYEEDWVKVDGEWLIQRQNLHFFWPERTVSGDDFLRAMPAPTPI